MRAAMDTVKPARLPMTAAAGASAYISRGSAGRNQTPN